MMMRLTRWLFSLFAAYLFVVLVLTAVFRFVPPVSALMVASFISGDGAHRQWVPLRAISPNAVRAILVSEDARFCLHDGIDWHSVDKAIDQAGERRNGPRGASTITMQVVKNLFLWNGRSWLRKAIEAPLALGLDLAWPKWRIMEVYLNIAQWGHGTFGIEAASQQAFGISARQLSTQQGALLAAALPDPTQRHTRAPGPGQQAIAAYLQSRLAREGAETRCLRHR